MWMNAQQELTPALRLRRV
jgi:hypothetical protein